MRGELTPKRLELISELVPQAGVIALLVNPNLTSAVRVMRDVQEAARAKRIPAIGTCEHPLAADDAGIAANPLGNEPRVLDEICCRVEHPWDQHFVVGKTGFLESSHSCAWRGLAASKLSAVGRALKQMSMILAKGMSWVWGPS
jgi:hypothetical protein